MRIEGSGAGYRITTSPRLIEIEEFFTDVHRPFVITQPVPAFPGESIEIQVDHEGRGAVGFSIAHPIGDSVIGARLTMDTIVSLAKALNTIIEEQASGRSSF